MATREDVSEALMLSVQRAEKIAAGVSEADLARQVYDDGWTVRDVLAHLASMGMSPAFFVGMAQRAASGGSGGGMGAGFDINAFNRQQVEARKDKSVFELVAELRQGHEQGVQLIGTTPDDVLLKKMPDPFQGGMSTALEMIQGSVADHEAQHLMDIARVLRA